MKRGKIKDGHTSWYWLPCDCSFFGVDRNFYCSFYWTYHFIGFHFVGPDRRYNLSHIMEGTSCFLSPYWDCIILLPLLAPKHKIWVLDYWNTIIPILGFRIWIFCLWIFQWRHDLVLCHNGLGICHLHWLTSKGQK